MKYLVALYCLLCVSVAVRTVFGQSEYDDEDYDDYENEADLQAVENISGDGDGSIDVDNSRVSSYETTDSEAVDSGNEGSSTGTYNGEVSDEVNSAEGYESHETTDSDAVDSSNEGSSTETYNGEVSDEVNSAEGYVSGEEVQNHPNGNTENNTLVSNSSNTIKTDAEDFSFLVNETMENEFNRSTVSGSYASTVNDSVRHQIDMRRINHLTIELFVMSVVAALLLLAVVVLCLKLQRHKRDQKMSRRGPAILRTGVYDCESNCVSVFDDQYRLITRQKV